MVTSTQLLNYAQAQPFRPFRLNMASGKTYDIRHPEMVKVLKSYVLVFFFPGGDSLADHYDTVSLMLTKSVSHLDVPVSS